MRTLRDGLELGEEKVFDLVESKVKESSWDGESNKDPVSRAIPKIVEELGAERFGYGGLEWGIHVEGTLPVLFTCPHGGYNDVKLPFNERERGGIDKRSKEFTLFLAYLFKEFYREVPHVLVNEVPRKYVDLNRGPTQEDMEKISDKRIRTYGELLSDMFGKDVVPESSNPVNDERLLRYYEEYHSRILDSLEHIVRENGSGLHIAWHTFGVPKPGKYKKKDLYAHKNNMEDGEDLEEALRPLPIEVQRQVNNALIFGTHLRRTVSNERDIDIKLQRYFLRPGKGQIGEQVYVPSEEDDFSILGGQYEICHGSIFRSGKNHPIDSIQVEVKKNAHLTSFERTLYLALNAIGKAASHY